uniref:RBBP8 N-terminal-like protein n=1 Tax=Jaculus jaculus TaxID=51337 RepID=UPI001E1B3405|nr:RBBP8 N-terminal-like protein [Jaculus jaculus]XP_045013390.1 RBBP8 N-terminal-like protein [Jaculus jaculus]
MDSFMESLNRLKEAHEKEVLGLQNKLLELNSERCRDAQRVEELFTKNHQLREQQKALKENLRALENRLRAGLCDRCMVTQELARKKQLELESTHLQSLQRLCVLTNEMNRLKEENKTLKEEVKRLQGLGDKPAPLTREGASDPPSPLSLSSPGGWKGAAENPLAGPEEAEEDQARTEKPASHRMSPVARISPGTTLPDPRALDMSPQCISNQLHSTVAVVRPGSRACPMDCGTANGTPPLPPTRSSPPSPTYEHGLPLDSFLQASRPSAYESLKRSLQAERLCLLNRHLSLHLRSPHHSSLAPATASRSPQPHSLKAGEMEGWEEPTGLSGLPGALVGIHDPRLEGALHLLLAQQHLKERARASSARLRGPSMPEEMPTSPPASSDSETSDSEAPKTALSTAAHPGGQHPQPTGPGSSWRKKTYIVTQNCAPDKPLDLSDRGRGRDTPKSSVQALSLGPTASHTLRPQSLTPSRSLSQSPQPLSNGTKGTKAPEPKEPSHALSCPYVSLPSPDGTAGEVGGRPGASALPQRPDPDRRPEASKAGPQRPESEELEDPDTSDSEVGSEAGAKLSKPGEGCVRLQEKRKRASDPGDKAFKKPSQGRKKPREALTADDSPRNLKDTEDCSSSPSNSSQET